MNDLAGHFPAAHSVLDPAALLREVADQYAVGAPLGCALLRSWINEVYAVETSRGQYILKVFRRGWRAPEELAYEVELIGHLAARGVCVAPPLARRDGAAVGLLPAAEGARPALLFPLLVGRRLLPPDEAVYERVGRAVATMHRALDTFASVHPRSPLDLDYLLDRPLAWVQPQLADRPADWAFLTALAGRVRARIERLSRSGLAWGPIHGDATLDNLLGTPDGQIGIYDFDQSGPGWRAYELQGVFHYAHQGGGRPGFWSAALAGYRSVLPLGDPDIAAMPAFVVMNHCWCMGFEAHVIARNHGRWIVDDGYFDRRLEVLRRWAAAYPELAVE